MQHSTYTALPYEGQLPLRVVLKFLLLASLGAFVIVSQSLSLLITTGLGLVLVLAFLERVQRLDEQQAVSSRPFVVSRVDDGGTFPGHTPERQPVSSNPRVIDGGSLEHHRR